MKKKIKFYLYSSTSSFRFSVWVNECLCVTAHYVRSAYIAQGHVTHCLSIFILTSFYWHAKYSLFFVLLHWQTFSLLLSPSCTRFKYSAHSIITKTEMKIPKDKKNSCGNKMERELSLK